MNRSFRHVFNEHIQIKDEEDDEYHDAQHVKRSIEETQEAID